MHTCEIFSIRKNKADFEALQESFDSIYDTLAEQGVEVRFRTEISADPKKLCAAVSASVQANAAKLYLFANALNTSDSSSFKSLFYEFIAEQEAGLAADEAHEGMTPKIKIFSIGDLGNGYKGYCFRCRNKVFVAVPCASLTGKELSELLCEALARAADILTEKREEFPDGIVCVPGKAAVSTVHKKEGFFMSFIPHRGDTKGDVVRKVIVLAAIVAFVVSAAFLINILRESGENSKNNTEIQMIAHRGAEDSPEDATAADGSALSSEDWAALKKVNKEIVGWITLKDTPINYPVLLHEGDSRESQYYLNHSYKQDWSDYGAIFVDYRSTEGVNSKNVILHGHNMLDGSMFHELVNYSSGFSGKLDYYQKHAVITFNTPEGDAKWKVISVFKTSTLFSQGEFFNYMQGSFNSDAEFMNFVYNVRIRSLFNTPVTVNEDDQILTLSTCSYEYKGFRTVVVARKVRPGESDTVDVNLATVNPSPLFPEVYYSGGSRPDPLTFKTAYAMGKISWYDGEGDPQKLEGSEDLTATIAANAEQATAADGTPAPGYTYYHVYYRNLDKTQIAAYTVREGDPVPVPSVRPTYEDENYYYTFAGWDRDIPGVNFNALNTSVTIYPKYTYTRKVQPTDPPTEPAPDDTPTENQDEVDSGEDTLSGDSESQE